MLTLRPATNSDQAAIESLIFPILESFGLKPDPGGTDADLGDLQGNYEGKGGFFSVLEDPDLGIVGSVAVHRDNETRCELRKMYLHDSLRGDGWGRKLLDHAIEYARKLGFREMWLETATSLEQARKLYQSYGFVPFHPPHLAERCDLALILIL